MSWDEGTLYWCNTAYYVGIMNAQDLLDNTTTIGKSELGVAYRELASSLVNPNATAAKFSLITSFDPTTNVSGNFQCNVIYGNRLGFVKAVRPLLEKYSVNGISWYLLGDMAAEADCYDITMEYFPYVILVSHMLVSVLISRLLQ